VCRFYLILDLLSIHFGVGKITEDAAQVLTTNEACVATIVEGKSVLDFVFLNERKDTISSESLLLALDTLALAMFFLTPFISYRN
jgi:hypothetical protein